MAAVGMVLLTILKILGWVLLAAAALLAFVLLVPVEAVLRYERGVFSVSAGMLGIRVRLWPRPEKSLSPRAQARREAKERAKAAKAAKKKQGGEKPKKQPKEKAKLTFDAVCGLADTAGPFLRAVLGGLRITGIRLYWPVHADDAAATALLYGKTQAWLHAGLALLDRVFWLDFKECRLDPDFTGKQAGTEYFSCKISARLLIIAVAAVKLILRLKDEDVLDAFL